MKTTFSRASSELVYCAVFLLAMHGYSLAVNGQMEFKPVIGERDGAASVEWLLDGERAAVASESDPLGVELLLPGAEPMALRFANPRQNNGRIEFALLAHGELTFQLVVEQKTPALIERRVAVTNRGKESARFSLVFSLYPTDEGEQANRGEYAAFTGPVDANAKTTFDTLGGGPEYPNTRGQTFPVAMMRKHGRVIGIVADSPAMWENRCQVVLDPPSNRLAVATGDGRESHELTIRYDARDKYSYAMDGWQHLQPGETKTYTTWLFASPAKNHYQAQLAAHLTLANAKGWNGSALEAILRNTAYLLMRRNLMRDEGRYIFISGIGYGWKQWVTDGFYLAIAHDDPEKTIEACRSVFLNRITYEDNAQYYLIWSALLKRAGGKVDEELVRQSYEFIRKHEHDGIFYPPPLPGASNPKAFKTYMDLLPYEDDDAPTSNQGFHCGALLAAQELGLDVEEEDIERAIAGYRRMFNEAEGYMPTSFKQQDILGQDSLYGATLTFALFGKKLLTDEQVLAHHRHSVKTASPYGLRVISKANGELLPGHSGRYVYGGSWFLCDAANYLLAGAHGLPEEEVDAQLIKRIELEIAHVPAFHESISTVTGEPNGHILYSWNSGYWRLRKEFRRRQGQTDPDPVEAAIDRKLGVVRDEGGLRIQ